MSEALAYPDELATNLPDMLLRRVRHSQERQEYLHIIDDLSDDPMPSGREIARYREVTARLLEEEAASLMPVKTYRAIMDYRRCPAGVATLIPHQDVAVIGFCVAVQFRRIGLATATVQALANLARRQGYQQIAADVRPDNLPSQAILYRQGLTMTERWRRPWTTTSPPGDWLKFSASLELLDTD